MLIFSSCIFSSSASLDSPLILFPPLPLNLPLLLFMHSLCIFVLFTSAHTCRPSDLPTVHFRHLVPRSSFNQSWCPLANDWVDCQILPSIMVESSEQWPRPERVQQLWPCCRAHGGERGDLAKSYVNSRELRASRSFVSFITETPVC